MSKDAAKQISELREEISWHDYLYYAIHEPKITDQQYDKLLSELKALEAKHPELIDPYSPTQRVSEMPVSGFETVAHSVPMLSVDNTYNADDLREFDKRIALTGVILSKLDGDARGGAALSLRSVLGKPIKYVGVGEGLDDLEPFHPDRMAQRILGMGDVLTLVEKAQEVYDEEKAVELERKLRRQALTLEDQNGAGGPPERQWKTFQASDAIHGADAGNYLKRD